MRALKFSPRDAKRLTALLDLLDGDGDLTGLDRDHARAESRHIRLAAAPRRKPERKTRAPGRSQMERKAERNLTTAEVRRAVWTRAKSPTSDQIGYCECGCGRTIFESTFHMDHWIGGSSRNEMNTVANCWALHGACDDDKTNMGAPGRYTVEEWNEARRWHCEKHGIPFVPRKATRYYQARASSRSTGTP